MNTRAKISLIAGCLSGTVLATGLTPHLAMGADSKSFPGAFCRRMWGQTDLMVNSWGTAYNSSSTTETNALCPFEVDTVAPPSQMDDEKAWITVDDGSNDTGVDCWLRIYSGSTQTYSNYDGTGASETGMVKLDSFNQSGDPFLGEDTQGYFRCVLPPKDVHDSRIINYSYTESDY